MIIAYWTHKGKTAENCCLLSDCSLKTPLSIKERKILFSWSLWISPIQRWASGSGNFMFHRWVLRSPRRKLPWWKKKKIQNNPQIPIQLVPGGLCRLRTLMSLTAAVEQELAPAKHWQKHSPGIHLYCQSSEQRFPFLLPGDVRVRWDTELA